MLTLNLCAGICRYLVGILQVSCRCLVGILQVFVGIVGICRYQHDQQFSGFLIPTHTCNTYIIPTSYLHKILTTYLQIKQQVCCRYLHVCAGICRYVAGMCALCEYLDCIAFMCAVCNYLGCLRNYLDYLGNIFHTCLT